MVEKIKKFIKDFRIIIGIIAFIFFGGVALAGWAKLPKKVEEIEKKATDNSVYIGKVSDSLNLFIMEQRTIQKSQDRREELMLELIRQK